MGGEYYVIDGHHRVSVARSLGRATINARVVEVKTRAPLGRKRDAAALLRAAEYAAFLETTQLHRTRPEARLECSRLGRYDEILKHILGHGYFLGLEQGRPVPLPEAAASWYDHVYKPVAEAIRKHRVLELLPGWTEADLYVEITHRWLKLSLLILRGIGFFQESLPTTLGSAGRQSRGRAKPGRPGHAGSKE